jgi:16S rRNA (cytosine967-C5)-methyltransferase
VRTPQRGKSGRAGAAQGNARRVAPLQAPSSAPPGLAARDLAVALLASVLRDGHTLEDAMDDASRARPPLEARDRAFARLIAATVLRRQGELEAVLRTYLEKPLPARQGRLWPILLGAAAQLLMLGTPPHAAVALAVAQCRRDPGARRFDRLANAVLRRVAEHGAAVLAGLDAPRCNIPDWLWQGWVAAYGEATARRIAAASLVEAPLDISVKSEPEVWAERFDGIVLPTGSVRLPAGGRLVDLAGYADGAWWVQDAAAALPPRLFGEVGGLAVADLCAAPGGKTALLAASGAAVTAVDVAPDRLERIRENLARLKLTAALVVADVTAWAPERVFDAVLLDAPCTATGTLRRHPDILRLKRPGDLDKLVALQARLLEAATKLVRPGGLLVYCTCSLEPAEGEDQVTRLLESAPDFVRVPIAPEEIGGEPDWITAAGDLRTLPFHLQRPEPGLSGLDGFYAARLRRLG